MIVPPGDATYARARRAVEATSAEICQLSLMVMMIMFASVYAMRDLHTHALLPQYAALHGGELFREVVVTVVMVMVVVVG
jgi:hypothetical protein